MVVNAQADHLTVLPRSPNSHWIAVGTELPDGKVQQHDVNKSLPYSIHDTIGTRRSGSGSWSFTYEFQQQLHMVSHKGHELAFDMTASRLPVIVLDAGGGNNASYWTNMNSTIAADLAKKTGSMTITYDRSGMGLSEYVPGPWKPKRAAGDLKAGLGSLSVTDHRSIILVSHSVTGEVAYFARSSPHWIAGAVLVDASVPEFFTDNVVAKFVAAYTPEIAALKNQPLNYSTLQLLAYVEDFGAVHRAFHKVSWPKRVPAIAIVSSEKPFLGDLVDAQL